MKKAGKILVLTILGLFLISFFANFVLAAPPTVQDIGDSARSIIEKIFGTDFAGNETYSFDLILVKALFAFLLFLVIVAVTDFIPLLKDKGWIQYPFSIVVTYLSIMYITPKDFYTILIPYTTMAIVVTSIIPLAIILAITYKISDEPTAGKIILQKVLLGLYAVVLIWRSAQLIWWPETISTEGQVSVLALPLYGGTLLIVILLLIFNRTVRRFILSSKVKGYIEVAGTLDKEEMLGQVMLLRKKANALKEAGADDMATNLIAAATRIKNQAEKMSE
jgi:hypothetical protein